MNSNTIQKTGDMLSERGRAILVHGCNAQGAMGSGIALAIRNTYPSAYNAYNDFKTKNGKLYLGDVIFVAGNSYKNEPNVKRHIHAFSDELPPTLIIANAITQEYFGRQPGVVYVDYFAIEAAFARIALVARDAKANVNYPMIGAGLGGGDWNQISQDIGNALRGLPNTFWTFPVK